MTTTTTTADLAAIALGNNGQSYSFFAILNEDRWVDVPEGLLYHFQDGSAILDSGPGGGWDVARQCGECGSWGWASEPSGDCAGCRA